MPPFTVLHVCMGNICRSPMAERLTVLAAQVHRTADDVLYVHSAGTGGWHAGQPMDSGAARQVLARGGATNTFTARKLRAAHVVGSDLVLTATVEQREFVVSLHPDADARTFVLGEFGRLLAEVSGELPSSAPSAQAVYARGTALVAAVHAARDGRPARPADELDDPWGRGDGYFSRIADEIEQTVRPLIATLLGAKDASR